MYEALPQVACGVILIMQGANAGQTGIFVCTNNY